MDENNTNNVTENEEVEFDNTTYQEVVDALLEAKKMFDKAVYDNDPKAAVIWSNIIDKLAERIEKFDTNSLKQYQTMAEINCKLEMNKNDNETKLEISRRENETRLKANNKDNETKLVIANKDIEMREKEMLSKEKISAADIKSRNAIALKEQTIEKYRLAIQGADTVLGVGTNIVKGALSTALISNVLGIEQETGCPPTKSYTYKIADSLLRRNI